MKLDKEFLLSNKDNIKTFCGSLLMGGAFILASSATGGLSVVAAPIMLDLAKAVTSNILSNHVAKVSNISFDKLADRLKVNDPNKVNHDLERLFRKASIVALEYIKELFLQDVSKIEGFDNLKKKDKEEFLEHLKSFFTDNISYLKSLMETEEREPLDKNLIKDPQQFLDNIVENIFKYPSIIFDADTKQLLKTFYANRLPYCFELAFKEALKHDDLGFKAFQIWILEEMQLQNTNILEEQKKISSAIKGLKNNISFLNKKEEEKKWDIIADKIYALLEKDFDGITVRLQQLDTQIKIVLDRVDAIYDEIKKIAKTTTETKEIVVDTANKVGEIVEDLKEIKENIKQIPNTSQGFVPPRALTIPPPAPQYFIGRERDLEAIKENLFKGNKVLPLSGDGGLGKTSVASAYYHQYSKDYKHAAWLVNVRGIEEVLLSLGKSLNPDFDGGMLIDKGMGELIKLMTSLPETCLLIIDNADNGDDIKNNHQLLRSFPNFHIIITTRLNELGGINCYKLEPLSEEDGLKIFVKYYPNHRASENELFYKIYEAIGGNTLVIELLAKSLKKLNKKKMQYTLENLLHELQNKGVLKLSKPVIVEDVDYHAQEGKMRKESAYSIIRAMYEISHLSESDIKLLSVFAVLPSQNISYETLELLLSEMNDLDDTLDKLYETGWIDFNDKDKFYQISPVIQEIIRDKNASLLLHTRPLINALISKLKYDTIDKVDKMQFHGYAITTYENLVRFIIGRPECLDNDVAILLGIFCYFISDEYNNHKKALQADRFIEEAIFCFERILTPELLKNLANNKKAETLANKDLKSVETYQLSLELSASIKLTLGSLNTCGNQYSKAKVIANEFQLKFYEYGHNIYLGKAGRLMEAEPYFFKFYKDCKFSYKELCSINSDEELLIYYKLENSVANISKARESIHQARENTLAWYSGASLELANIFRTQGRFEEAIYFHKKFLELMTKGNSSKTNLNTAIGKHAMAITLLMRGKNLGLADLLLSEVMAVYQSTYNPNHYHIGLCYKDIFLLILKMGIDIKKSAYAFNKANEIISQSMGDNNRDIIEMRIALYEHLAISKNNDEEKLALQTELENTLIDLFANNLTKTIDKFGIYHPVFHKGLALGAQILMNRNQAEGAQTLLNKQQEFVRILNKRTYIRTYDLPSKMIRDDEKEELVCKIKPITSLPIHTDKFELEIIALPFYKNYDLCKIRFLNTSIESYKYVLVSKQDAIAIGGTNKSIYDLGKKDLILNDSSIKYYVTFFFDNVTGKHGKCYLLNDYQDIPWRLDVAIDDKFKEGFNKNIRPIEVISSDDEQIILRGIILFKNSLFDNFIKVNKMDGTINIFNEKLIFIDITKPEFVSVDYMEEENYRSQNPSCNLLEKIPAQIDPIYEG